ncbi:MAG: AAA family ATPase [Desulfuromusa sp.]
MLRRITAITLENFKAISTPIRIDLAPITLLFGQNSVGKSTIIQALHYLREILENENLDPDTSFRAGKTFDLGGFESIINGHDLSKTIKMRVDFVFGVGDLTAIPKHVTNPFKQGV